MQRAVLRETVRDIVVNGIFASVIVPPPLRWHLMRLVGFDLHGTWIAAGCFFSSTRVSIDANSFVNYRCFFDGAGITIGRDCAIGMEAFIGTNTHHPGTPTRRSGALLNKAVSIGDGVWVGARSTILPGVSIADGCVIAAGSVVTGDCETDGLYAGCPARRVRDL
jgi:maltose O-acetyltransferase